MEERKLETPEGTSFNVNNISLGDLLRGPTAEELAHFKPLAVNIATRRISHTMLDISYLPPELKGDWIFNDPITINEYLSMGYVFPPEEIIKESLHHDGTGKAIHGDVILMVIPRWKWELLDDAKTRQYESIHRIGNDSREDRELRKVASDASREGKNEVTANVAYSHTNRLNVSKK
jgi:hypothetical protein